MALAYRDLDSVQRVSTGTPVSATWFDQVNDNVKYLYQFSPQSGTVAVTTDASGNATITFPTAFTVYAVTVIAQVVQATASAFVYSTSGTTLTAFVVHTNAVSATITIGWIAKDY